MDIIYMHCDTHVGFYSEPTDIKEARQLVKLMKHSGVRINNCDYVMVNSVLDIMSNTLEVHLDKA